MVDPYKATFQDYADNNFELWVVFKKDEYLIVYDEEWQEYALAFVNIQNEKFYIGENGNLSRVYHALISAQE